MTARWFFDVFKILVHVQNGYGCIGEHRLGGFMHRSSLIHSNAEFYLIENLRIHSLRSFINGHPKPPYHALKNAFEDVQFP